MWYTICRRESAEPQGNRAVPPGAFLGGKLSRGFPPDWLVCFDAMPSPICEACDSRVPIQAKESMSVTRQWEFARRQPSGTMVFLSPHQVSHHV
jgi:hypothetical protein